MTNRQSTEDLIRDLAARPAPAPFHPVAAVTGMLGVLALGLGLYFLGFGLRPDMGAAWQHLPVQAKTVLPVLLSGAAVWLAIRSSRPEGQVSLWPLALPVLLALLLFANRFASADGSRLAETAGQTALACLVSITFLSAFPLAAGILALRRAAPTRPVLTGALLGIAAGAGVAAGYALHCTEDSPLFFVVWYGLAIAIAGGSGAFMGHRLLRW
jgi:hypothetical protein